MIALFKSLILIILRSRSYCVLNKETLFDFITVIYLVSLRYSGEINNNYRVIFLMYCRFFKNYTW